MGQYQKQYQSLPGDERALIAAVVEAQTREEREQALKAYCKLREAKRLYQRRRGEDDRWRRSMLAIHVPFSYAQAVAARADAEGLSVYAWLRRAIDQALT